MSSKAEMLHEIASVAQQKNKVAFNPDSFVKALEVKLMAEGFFDRPGAKDPRNWIFSKDTFRNVLRNGENPTEAMKFAAQGGLGYGEVLQLASSNNGSIDVRTQFTVAWEGLMQEITPALGVPYGLKEYFADQLVNTEQVQWTMEDPISGVTPEYVYGEDPASLSILGNRQIAVQAVPYREQQKYTERELTFWRNLATSDLSVSGAMQRLGLGMQQLTTRLMNREYQLIADSIVNGYFSYQGQNFSYDIPTQNRLTPQYGPWATVTGDADPVWNSSANPLLDLMQWLNNDSVLVKYRPYIRTLHMNYKTWVAFISNPNVNKFVSWAPANPTIVSPDSTYASGAFVKVYVPGMENIRIVIEDASYIPDDLVEKDTTGSYYKNSTAKYFLADGQIFFGIDTTLAGKGPLGRFIMTSTLQNGGVGSANPGRFIMLNDNIPAGTMGGPAKPYIGIVAGMTCVNAIVRNNDIFTANVFTTT